MILPVVKRNKPVRLGMLISRGYDLFVIQVEKQSLYLVTGVERYGGSFRSKSQVEGETQGRKEIGPDS